MEWLKEWQWFSKADTLQLFLYLLLNASPKDKFYCGKPLKRGQIITTIPVLVKELGSTTQKVRTNLDRLANSQEINRLATAKYSVITICKYDTYIGVQTALQQSNNSQITALQQSGKENFPPTPPLKENNNKYSSSSSISACEEKNFIEILKSDRQWGEVIAMRFSLGTLDALDSWIEKFALDLQCRDIIHKDLQDAKRHFNDWLRIQLKSENDTENKQRYSSRDKADIIRERQEQHMRDIERINADYLAKVGQQPD